MSHETININASFDLQELRDSIQSVDRVEDAEAFFEQLTRISKAKAELAALSDALASVEQEAKGLINAKAKALYGEDWQTVKGHGFKITRSRTGAVYDITGKPQAKFVKVKKSVDSKAVEEFIVRNDGKLPAGIDYNPKRGESIRITVEGGE